MPEAHDSAVFVYSLSPFTQTRVEYAGEPLSMEDVDELGEWFALVLRSLRRRVRATSTPAEADE